MVEARVKVSLLLIPPIGLELGLSLGLRLGLRLRLESRLRLG